MNFIIKKSKIFEANLANDFLNIGIAARAINNINYSDDLNNYRKNEKDLLCKTTDITPKNILFLNQIHGDTILSLTKPIIEDTPVMGDADAIITTIPGTCPVIRTADCVPVFIFDTKKKILGAVHSGWKGTKLKICQKTALKMKNEFESLLENLMVFILPSISVHSYEVSKDVADYFPNDLIIEKNKIYLNLWSNIEKSLKEIGIPKENIFNSHTCNYINKDEFFSHRRGDIGRNLNFAYF